jgi:hypothetical protein
MPDTRLPTTPLPTTPQLDTRLLPPPSFDLPQAYGAHRNRAVLEQRIYRIARRRLGAVTEALSATLLDWARTADPSDLSLTAASRRRWTQPLTLGRLYDDVAPMVDFLLEDLLGELVDLGYTSLTQGGEEAAAEAAGLPGPVTDAIADYLLSVRDRLSRQILPEIAEDAFDRVRVQLARSITQGWSREQLAGRIAADLSWEIRGEQLRTAKAATEQQIDEILDRLGPPGTPARETARLNDPAVQVLQAERAEIVQQLDAERTVWETRARRIARTESTAMNGWSSVTQLQAEGWTHKKWLALNDSRTREAHHLVDDEVVPIDQPFMVDGYPMRFPGDPTAPAELVINCRCSVGHAGEKLTASTDDEAIAASLAFGYNPTQARVPAGQPTGGRWTRTPSALGGGLQSMLPGMESASVLPTTPSDRPYELSQDLLDVPDDPVVHRNLEKARQDLAPILAEAPLLMRVNGACIQDLATGSGQIKAISDLDNPNKTSSYIQAREDYETNVAGFPADANPISGYLGTDEVGQYSYVSPEAYGDFQVELKEDVRNRSTFTIDDSLDRAATPAWITDDLSDEALYAAGGNDPYSGNPFDSSAGVDLDYVSYIETQVHGGVQLGDIAFITIPEYWADYSPRGLPGGVADAMDWFAALQAKGVSVRWPDNREFDPDEWLVD